MGIRINKSIGYGLLDLEKGTKDPRLNLDKDHLESMSEEKDLSKFIDFLGKKECVDILINVFKEEELNAKWDHDGIVSLDIKEFKRKEKGSRGHFTPSNIFDYDTEGSNDWIVFYPLSNIQSGYNCWKRHDDNIDYYENRIYREDLTDNIVDLSKKGVAGFFPYNHKMYLKPGRENKIKDIFPKYFGEVSKKENSIDAGYYNMLIGKWDSKNPNKLVTDEIYNHLVEDWAPLIPTTIKLFVHYYDILKNPLTVYDFKPMFCQWWS